MTKEEAMALATARELDLVEVSPLSQPPVCKIMDYGKFQYRQNKIDQKHRKMQKKGETKGIRISLKTEQHDLEVKAKQARQFLDNKDSLKVSLVFKGRESAHAHLAQEKMKEFAKLLSDIAKIEQEPKKQGNTMMMLLLPSNKQEQPEGTITNDQSQIIK